MKNKHIRIFLSITFALTCMIYLSSCSDDSFETSNTQVQLSYLDADGMDMLDSINGFDPHKVDIYYMINGVKTRVNDNNALLPENFYIYYSDATTNFALVLFVNTRKDNDNKSVTLIDFGTKVDTLQTSFKVWDTGFKIEKVWYNGDLLTSQLDHKTPLVITVDRMLTSK